MKTLTILLLLCLTGCKVQQSHALPPLPTVSKQVAKTSFVEANVQADTDVVYHFTPPTKRCRYWWVEVSTNLQTWERVLTVIDDGTAYIRKGTSGQEFYRLAGEKIP